MYSRSVEYANAFRAVLTSNLFVGLTELRIPHANGRSVVTNTNRIPWMTRKPLFPQEIFRIMMTIDSRTSLNTHQNNLFGNYRPLRKYTRARTVPAEYPIYGYGPLKAIQCRYIRLWRLLTPIQGYAYKLGNCGANISNITLAN